MRPFNIFAALQASSSDVFQHVSQWLNIRGPHVRLIEDGANDEQKAAVVAVAGPSLSYESWQYVNSNNEPDLSVYHIIIGYSDAAAALVYQIGFCQLLDGKLTYQTRTINPESALFRYLKEDLQGSNSLLPPQYSRLFKWKNNTRQVSEDRLLLQLVEADIQAAGGLVHPHLRNRKRLAMAWHDTHRIMNGIASFEKEGQIFRFNRQVVSSSIKCRVLEDALHHIAYGEEAKAMDIIKIDFSLLQSHLEAPVTFCAPEIHCPKTTAFGLAFLLGDWFLLKKIVQAIESSPLSEGTKLAYKLDLLHQIEEIEENGCKVIIDNLLNKGVQILDADVLDANPEERKRYEEDVVNRNSYHLIIQTFKENEKRSVISCVLGYRDPTTGQYTQKEIGVEEELFKVVALELYEGLKNANNGHGIHHEHFFTRSNRDLALVRAILEKQLDVNTYYEEILKPQDFKKLLNYLDIRIQDWQKWPEGRLREQWYGEICAELRLLPPVVWQYWLSEQNPWSLDERAVAAFINSPGRPGGDKNFYNEPIFPLPSSLGDRFIAPPRGYMPGALLLLKSILKVEQQERLNLKTCLQAGLDLTRRRAPVV